MSFNKTTIIFTALVFSTPAFANIDTPASIPIEKSEKILQIEKRRPAPKPNPILRKRLYVIGPITISMADDPLKRTREICPQLGLGTLYAYELNFRHQPKKITGTHKSSSTANVSVDMDFTANPDVWDAWVSCELYPNIVVR